MAGGLGFLTTWESTTGGGNTSIHMAFGSTATNTVFDPAAGFPPEASPASRLALRATMRRSPRTPSSAPNVAGTISVDPTAQGYEIVDVNNDTLEFGFHVAYVQKASAADAAGDIKLARYDIPVYDGRSLTGAIVTDANGNPTRRSTSVPARRRNRSRLGNDGARHGR